MAAPTRTLTEKQERYAQLVVLYQGDRRKAYREAFDVAEDTKDTTVNNNSWVTMQKPHVAARIRELRNQSAERMAISHDTITQELAKLAFANLRDYISVTEDGDAYVDLGQLTYDQAAAISELTVEEYTEGRGDDKRDVKRTKIKLSPKREALAELGKFLGLQPPTRVDHTSSDGSMSPVQPADVADALRSVLAEL